MDNIELESSQRAYQDLEDKYIRMAGEYQHTLVRLRNANLLLGVTDRLDAAITNIDLIGRILVDTFVARFGAKRAAIFIAEISATPQHTPSATPEGDLLAPYVETFKRQLIQTSLKTEAYACVYQLNVPSAQRVRFVPHQHSLFWLEACNGRPFSSADATGHCQALPYQSSMRECQLDDLGLYYWIPLLNPLDNQVLGLIGLDITAQYSLESEFIERLTAQGVRALRNAVWYRQLESSRIALARQVSKLETLYDVGRALSAIDDRDHLLKDILRYAAEIVHAQKGSIMLLEEASNELVVSVVYGIDADTEEKILRGLYQTKRFKIGEGIAGQVAQSRRPVVLNNPTTSKMFVHTATSNVTSILCVPLVVHDDLQGVLNITNKELGQPFTNDDLQIILQVADQAAMALYNAHLYELAVTDGLTKVFIRRHFFSKFAEELKRATRTHADLSLLMIDIDFFKKVNDTYGHQCGDYVLAELAAVLRAQLRDLDIIGRYGGEEFAILLVESNAVGALIAATRIQSALEEHIFQWQPEGQEEKIELRISVSIGVASYPDHASDQRELLQRADEALYYSKRQGRNRTSLYGEKVRQLMLQEPRQNKEFSDWPAF